MSSPHRSPFRVFLLLAVAFATGLFPAFASTDQTRTPPEAWAAAATGLFADAHAHFATQAPDSDGVADHEAQLGRAVTLLQLQPKTETRIRAAADVLDTLLASTSGEIAANARFFRARIEHVHRSTPDLPAAVQHYERLIADHPGHPLAEQAVVKLAIIQLYRQQSRPDLEMRFTEFAARTEDLASTGARRDLHLLLGETALRFNLGERAALDHFLAALEAGILLRSVRADTLVRSGELAVRLGQTDVARHHYQLFLDEFQRDPRRLTITQHLAALDATSPRTSTLAHTP